MWSTISIRLIICGILFPYNLGKIQYTQKYNQIKFVLHSSIGLPESGSTSVGAGRGHSRALEILVVSPRFISCLTGSGQLGDIWSRCGIAFDGLGCHFASQILLNIISVLVSLRGFQGRYNYLP